MTTLKYYRHNIKTRAPNMAEFENYHHASMALSNNNMNEYHVYKTKLEFVSIIAETAHEAILKSGCDNPVKVVKYIPELVSFLSSDMIKPHAEVPNSNSEAENDNIPEAESPSNNNSPEQTSQAG